MIKSDILIIGAGPVGLFAVFEAKRSKVDKVIRKFLIFTFGLLNLLTINSFFLVI